MQLFGDDRLQRKSDLRRRIPNQDDLSVALTDITAKVDCFFIAGCFKNIINTITICDIIDTLNCVLCGSTKAIISSQLLDQSRLILGMLNCNNCSESEHTKCLN